MKKIKVMHVVASWTIGGTERMLMYSLPYYSKSHFESKLVSLVDATSLVDDFALAGIPVENLNAPRNRFSFQGLFRLRKTIKSWRPDIVFTYGQRASILAKMVRMMTKSSFKLICGQRDIGNLGGKSHVWIERLTRWFPDLYISNSSAGADFLVNKVRLSPKRVIVIPNGIDFVIPDNVCEQAEQLKRDYHIPDNCFVLGTIGRLFPAKGHEYIIRAMPDILKVIPEAILVLVGEDMMKGSIQKIAEELNITDKVIFTGISRSIAAWHKIFDVFVLPSLSEATSTAMIEAMFSGLPIIATNVGGNPEVVVDGQTGILVPSHSAEALARAVVTLHGNLPLRKQFANAGLERANKYYSLKRMLDEYEAIFEKLC